MAALLGGRRRVYSDTAIEGVLVVRAVFQRRLRAAQGLLESVVKLMGLYLPVPCYTTVSRRQAGLALELGSSRTHTRRHVVIDTTGVKVFGAGKVPRAEPHGITRSANIRACSAGLIRPE